MSLYTIILVVIMSLAVLDLIVGVSNDAANFLNSAIGSKAAPRYVIMIVASVGVILGSVFSSGMMEIARSGVFNPAMFTFHDIMMIFLAVMMTDVILLDLFNSLGLPTSTTVSLVFELLGAAVTIALINIGRSDVLSMADLSHYINSSKAMIIIFGILISVVIAFICGSIIMFITRLTFSFRYQKSYQMFGPLWCGIAFTAISYFALFKGLKGSSLITPAIGDFLNGNTSSVMAGMFIFWTAASAFMQYLCKINVLRLTVLAGTFALALAFAGNDLVNFIGVSVAGFDSYRIFQTTGDVNMMMGDLNRPVVANTLILLTAGLTMAGTLWFSKKARKVIETGNNLSRQESGVERFGSTSVSRAIVRFALNVNRNYEKIAPRSVQRFVKKRFYPIAAKEKESAHFDLIRATVNLTVASLLISLGTSLKLPLSTTYVTFMVAMGSSLADRAWGRESAVYRITGVLTVVSGWFLTALVAFVVASVVACVLIYGGTIGIFAMMGITVLLLVQSSRSYNRKQRQEKQAQKEKEAEHNIIETCADDIRNTMKKVVFIYNQTLIGVFNEDRKLLKSMATEAHELHLEAHDRKYEIFSTLRQLQENEIHTGHYYVQVVDYLDEVTKALLHICRPCYQHIDNNHEGFTKSQVEDLMKINNEVGQIYDRIIDMLETSKFEDLDMILTMRDELFDTIAEAIINQIRRTKKGKGSSKTGALYLDIISETKTMVLQSRNLLKAQKFFVSNVKE